MKSFYQNQKILREQFNNICWIEESGVNEEQLRELYNELMQEDKKYNRAIIKAKLFEMLCTKSRIAIDKEDIFQDKLFGGNFINEQRELWRLGASIEFLSKEREEMISAVRSGAYGGGVDFGHTSPNSKLLLKVGFKGLLDRVEKAEQKDGLTDKQKQFYLSCKIVLNACITAVLRLAEAIKPFDNENYKALMQVANGAPTNSYEAMQLIVIYFFLHEYVCKTRVRTLGRLDVLLYPFYKKDVEEGCLSKAEFKEMLRFFLNKFSSAKVPFGLPFCIGGVDENGEETTNEVSYLIVETYQELDIYSPKIHVRVSEKTPVDFIKLVLNSIRRGQSSFVFCNDDVATRALTNVGIEKKDAREYTPIGCYEPAVWGKEMGCTGNASINMAKAIIYTFSDGFDSNTGLMVGAKTNSKNLKTFEDFYGAVKEQLAFMTKKCIDYVSAIEKHYDIIGPDPLLSSMYDDSIERGVDVYEGGAKYNNSSLYYYYIATFVDCLTAVKKIVYDEKRLTLSDFFNVLKNNWEGQESLRLMVKKMPEKYGNENQVADKITKDITDFCASICNNQPNGRGGVFKTALFSIDAFVKHGKLTMATPDGRKAGEPLSKNLCASWTMDKNGILALINSVTKIDHSKFPNGSVLDVVLHPSAVQGQDGLDAFYSLLRTYFSKGGFAMHGNVFNAEDLKKAQQHPEKYSTLQVRVCGWNAYFTTLTKEEQDAFIIQAENAI